MTVQVFCVWDSGMRIRLWLVENQKFDFLTCLDYDTYLEKETATHSSVLPGESQGRGNLVGCRLWGRTESDTTEVT